MPSNTVEVVLKGNEAHLWASMQKIIIQHGKLGDEQGKVEARSKRVGEAFRRTGDEAARMGTKAKAAGDQIAASFGERLTAGLQNTVTGLLGIGTALTAVTALWREYTAAMEGAAGRVAETVDYRGKLAALSGGNRQAYEGLLATADRISTTQGLDDQAALGVVHKSAQAGMADQAELFASMKPLGIDEDSAITFAQVMAENFTNDPSVRELMNETLAAAPLAKRSPNQIMEMASSLAPAYSGTGGNTEELLAMTTVGAKLYPTPERAGKKLRSLFENLSEVQGEIDFGKDGPLQGGALLMQLAEGRLRSKKDLGKDARTLLSDDNVQTLQMLHGHRGELVSAYQSMMHARGTTAVAGDRLGKAHDLLLSDPQAAPVLAQRVAKERGEQQQEDLYAVPMNQYKAYTNIQKNRLREMGVPEIGVTIGGWLNDALPKVIGPQGALAYQAAFGGLIGAPTPAETVRQNTPDFSNMKVDQSEVVSELKQTNSLLQSIAGAALQAGMTRTTAPMPVRGTASLRSPQAMDPREHGRN